MMIAIAALLSGRHAMRSVKTLDVVSEVIADLNSVQATYMARRVEGWLDTTVFIDSVAGWSSPYAAFVADVVDRAQASRGDDGTIDIARLAALTFVERRGSRQPTAVERAAVRFWLEEAGIKDLVDPAANRPEGTEAESLRSFPRRGKGMAGRFLLLAGVNPPPTKPVNDEGTLVDFVVWTAATTLSRGEHFDLVDLVQNINPDNPNTAKRPLLSGILEALGFDDHIARLDNTQAYLPAALAEARRDLRAGQVIDVRRLIGRIHGLNDSKHMTDVVTGWLRAVGLLEGPLDPYGLVGRLRALVRSTAAANPSLNAERLAVVALDEAFPTAVHRALVEEWLAEDPAKAYVVGVGRRMMWEEGGVSPSAVVREAISAEMVSRGSQDEVYGWLVEAGLLNGSAQAVRSPAVSSQGGVVSVPVPPVVPSEGGALSGGRTPVGAGLTDVRSIAEGLLRAGMSFVGVVEAVETSLPVRSADPEGFVHRLVLEHSAWYQRAFERAWAVMDDVSRGAATGTDLIALARELGLDVSAARVWSAHYWQLAVARQALTGFSPEEGFAAQSEAAGYLNARIGGLTLAEQPSMVRLLREERVLRVVRELRLKGAAGAVAEVEAIARELNLPRQTRGRLLGGTNREQEPVRIAPAGEAPESSTAAANRAWNDAGTPSGERRREDAPPVDSELFAFVTAAGEDGSPVGNTGEQWLVERDQVVWQGPVLTAEAVVVLKPLALALAQAAVMDLGGVVMDELAASVFSPGHRQQGRSAVESWLAEAGVRVLTHAEVPIARVVSTMAAWAAAGQRVTIAQVGKALFPTWTGTQTALYRRVVSYAEAGGHGYWERGTRDSMVVAVAALRASEERGYASVSGADIVHSLMETNPNEGSGRYLTRVTGWSDAAYFLDSLPGRRSVYAEFVAEVVEAA
ncbi:hypothetical protein, partial [Streptomyces sp. NPDC058548]